MSRTKPDRFERLALLAKCNKCEVRAGEWCYLLDRDSYAAELHATRGDQLTAAYWQGFDDGVEVQFRRSQEMTA